MVHHKEVQFGAVEDIIKVGGTLDLGPGNLLHLSLPSDPWRGHRSFWEWQRSQGTRLDGADAVAAGAAAADVGIIFHPHQKDRIE